MLQGNALLCSKIQTFKEINMDFLMAESNVYHMDSKDTLKLIYGARPEMSHAAYIAHKLATLCITLNEHPSVRFQASSQFANDVATILNDLLTEFKSANPNFKCYGDDRDSTRERGQLLICDRTIDPITPVMHEYTYQVISFFKKKILNFIAPLITARIFIFIGDG
jgi:syntaxin-binding protein 1